VDELHYLKLFTSLLGKVGTENYTAEELNVLITRYLSGVSVSAGSIGHDDGYDPYISVTWQSLNEDYEGAVRLVNELLYKSDMNDYETVKDAVTSIRASMRGSFSSGLTAFSTQTMRAVASLDEETAYHNYIGGIEYYQFLINASKTLEDDPEAFCEKITQTAEKLMVRDGVNVLYAGDAEGVAVFEDNIETALSGLVPGTIEPADYAPETYAHSSEAIIINSPVQFNVLLASLDEIGMEYNGKVLPLSLLLSDKYLIPVIRHDIGAYEAALTFVETSGEGNGAAALISINDPSVTETFEAYEGLADYLEGMELTQDEVDSYIVKAYSAQAMPAGELNGARLAMHDRLSGKIGEDKLDFLREIKSLTVEDVKNAGEAFKHAAETGFRSTLGGAQIIGEHSGLYEVFVDIAALDPEAALSPLTFGELSSLLAGGQDGAFEILEAAGAFALFDDITADSEVSREQLAALIAGMIPLDEGDVLEISDIGDISEWALEPVNLVVGNEMMALDENGAFYPQEPAYASDVQTILTRVMEMSGE
ncbi:MAG: hypothetical protein LBS19_14765, partial [Clostridiales bacterium]|jgi:Zn-dependent M16 (insulinase) family peptidase|nr:hypothetical protein [Clostridiales bacterium]